MTKRKPKPKPLERGEFSQLIVDIIAARKRLDSLPDDCEFTQEQLGELEDLRWTALRLAQEAEATIETFEDKGT